MNYFIYNNISSLEFDNLIVNQLPNIERAKEKVEEYEVQGRNGKLYFSTGSYESTTKELQCTLKNLNGLDELLSWLRGSGEIIFSNQPDRIFKARIINSIPFERVIKEFRSFIITLECQPFSYMQDQEKINVYLDNVRVLNQGNIYSEPKIKVVGSKGTILINDNEITINNNSDFYFYIDSESMNCYDETFNNMGRCMGGDFPILNEGVNTISTTGNIKIEIEPRWRYL